MKWPFPSFAYSCDTQPGPLLNVIPPVMTLSDEFAALIAALPPSRPARIASSQQLRDLVRDKLTGKWSPQQVSRFLVRTYPDQPQMRACP